MKESPFLSNILITQMFGKLGAYFYFVFLRTRAVDPDSLNPVPDPDPAFQVNEGVTFSVDRHLPHILQENGGDGLGRDRHVDRTLVAHHFYTGRGLIQFLLMLKNTMDQIYMKTPNPKCRFFKKNFQ
jgi:hypothetical protein